MCATVSVVTASWLHEGLKWREFDPCDVVLAAPGRSQSTVVLLRPIQLEE